MKRVRNLFDAAFSRENLYLAYLDASRHKRGTRACFNFERALGANLDDLHSEIHNGSYKPLPYYSFMVYEPKPRQIYAPAFRDLVIQHAIYRVVYPIFNRSFIAHSFACRRGYGTHKGADYAQRAMQQSVTDSYILKLDIRKFFYRIDRDILRGMLGGKIKDRRFVDLMMLFADHGEAVGIPIGNLLSQLYALIYLNPLDHFIKRVLKVKRYARYVDDFALFDLTRDQAIEYRGRIEEFLKGLKLEFSKTGISKTSRGINFVGYRTWRSKRFIRKRSVYRFKCAAKRGNLESAVSILGHAKRTHSRKHLVNFARQFNHAVYLQLPKNHHARTDGDSHLSNTPN